MGSPDSCLNLHCIQGCVFVCEREASDESLYLSPQSVKWVYSYPPHRVIQRSKRDNGLCKCLRYQTALFTQKVLGALTLYIPAGEFPVVLARS